jgi:hypothetical protein
MEIRLITTGESSLKDTIMIDTSDKPLLFYNGDDGVKMIDSTEIARNDHLDKLLQERDWNIGTRLYLGEDGKIKMSLEDNQDSPLPDMSGKTGGLDFEEDGNIDIQTSINKSYNQAIRFGDGQYSKLFKIIRSSLKSMEENSNNIKVLEKDYTGSINFNRFINSGYTLDAHHKVYNISNHFLARVEIAYTYQEKTYLRCATEEVIVKPFSLDFTKINSRYTSKDSRFLVEVIDGVLRVFPMKSDVRECFIQSYTLIFEEHEEL